MNQEILRGLVMDYGEFLENEDYSEDAVRRLFAEDAEVEFAMGGTGTGIFAIGVGHRNRLILRIIILQISCLIRKRSHLQKSDFIWRCSMSLSRR